jgi:hypothetical protein
MDSYRLRLHYCFSLRVARWHASAERVLSVECWVLCALYEGFFLRFLPVLGLVASHIIPVLFWL